ncbi:MAG: hypothetical protein WCL32_19760 [Planctomycetota bacterium]|jgi:hypothetical protein
MLRSFLAMLAVAAAATFAHADEVTLDNLKSTTPASWKSEKPSNKFRAYQFTVPKAKGDDADAEIVIFFFGPGGGGGTAENLKRWKGMFDAPEGKSIDDVSKVETFKIPKAEITYLDVKGTYLSKFPPFDPNAKLTRKENYRRLGVVFESENGPYFITVTGPANTVAAAKTDFDNWLKNFK